MRTHISTDSLAERLEGVRRHGAGWTARCPIHEDRINSLVINPGKKGTVVHCHAGCRTQDILAILDIEMAQLFYDYEYRSSWDKAGMSQELRDALAAQRPIDVWEDYEWQLLDVMANTLKLPEEEHWRKIALVGIEHPVLATLPFDPQYEQVYVVDYDEWGPVEYVERGALRMYSVLASGPMWTYLGDWFQRSRQTNWHDVSRRAITTMTEGYNRRRRYGHWA